MAQNDAACRTAGCSKRKFAERAKVRDSFCAPLFIEPNFLAGAISKISKRDFMVGPSQNRPSLPVKSDPANSRDEAR